MNYIKYDRHKWINNKCIACGCERKEITMHEITRYYYYLGVIEYIHLVKCIPKKTKQLEIWTQKQN